MAGIASRAEEIGAHATKGGAGFGIYPAHPAPAFLPRLHLDNAQAFAMRFDEPIGGRFTPFMKELTILLSHGRGTKPGLAGDTLTLARFNLDWLTGGKDTGR